MLLKKDLKIDKKHSKKEILLNLKIIFFKIKLFLNYDVIKYLFGNFENKE